MALRQATFEPKVVPLQKADRATVFRLSLVSLFLALATAHYLIAPLDRFDEGVTVTKAAMTAIGKVPYRDFWITYGPLDTYVLAAAFKVIAFNIMVERVLGAVVMVLFAATAFALTGYLRLRPPIRFLMTGLISVAPLPLATFNSPFLALLLGLLAILAFMVGVERGQAKWPILTGLLVGLVAFSRPELAIALGTGLAGGFGVLAVHPASRRARPLPLFLATAFLVALGLWGLMLLHAGIGPVWFDIVVHATRLYAPARSIPLGKGDDAAVVILLGLASTVVWGFGLLRSYRQRWDAAELARLTTLIVSAMLVFIWVRTRADGIHAFEAWPFTGLLLALLLQRRARAQAPASARLEAIVTTVGILMFCLSAGGLTLRDAIQPQADAGIARAGYAGHRAWISTAQLAQVIVAVDSSVPPSQPIWVGLQRNDLVVFNDTMLYFLTGRDPGTVYYESFPGLTNTEPGERAIACQLAASGVTTAVLGPNTAPEQWNLSAVPGSTYLDGWLARRTLSRREIAPYVLLRLRPGVDPSDQC